MTNNCLSTKKQFLAFLKVGTEEGLVAAQLGIFIQMAIGLFRDDSDFPEECKAIIYGRQKLEAQRVTEGVATFKEASIATDKHVYDDAGNCLTCYEPNKPKKGQKVSKIYSASGNDTLDLPDKDMFTMIEECKDYEEVMVLLIKRNGQENQDQIALEIQILHEHFLGDLPGKTDDQLPHEYNKQNIQRMLDKIESLREIIRQGNEDIADKMKVFDDAAEVRRQREIAANS